MRIQVGFTIEYQCQQPVPMLLLLSIHPSREADLLTPQVIAFDPPVEARRYTDDFGNVCHRIVAPAGTLTISTAFEIQDSGAHDLVVPDAKQIEVDDLPSGTLVYLLGSRYCDTDLLNETAWSLFGSTAPGWARVQAICDFANDRIAFGYEHARPDKTARHAYDERRGVCRDFAHLAVTLCRCMNIPARYCTGYLGDIGVPPVDAPMDFSAWFEAFLEGPDGPRWYTFDARHNKPRIGRLLMARGRDATDVALVTNFGAAWLAKFDVVTNEMT
ncbi:MAG: transglutaminase family protein [Gemmatimonadaceae bacterium]|nr:transglutaminase family protein [Acetobacteraceae bacterium]